MSGYISKLIFLLLTIQFCHGQDSTGFKAGINLFGGLLNTIDVELQYEFTHHISATLSGGRQFNARIPDLKNSIDGKASGSFIRAGVLFVTSKPERTARFFLRGEIIYSYLQHSTSIQVSDPYESFVLPYHHTSDRVGGSFGYGMQIKIIDELEADIAITNGFVRNVEQFMVARYPTPGFYIGQSFLFIGPSMFYFRPILVLKYKFNSH